MTFSHATILVTHVMLRRMINLDIPLMRRKDRHEQQKQPWYYYTQPSSSLESKVKLEFGKYRLQKPAL